MVRPRLIIALGDDARWAIRRECPTAPVAGWWPFPAPAELPAEPPADGPAILSMYHPSHVLRPWTAPQPVQWVADLVDALRWGFGLGTD